MTNNRMNISNNGYSSWFSCSIVDEIRKLVQSCLKLSSNDMRSHFQWLLAQKMRLKVICSKRDDIRSTVRVMMFELCQNRFRFGWFTICYFLFTYSVVRRFDLGHSAKIRYNFRTEFVTESNRVKRTTNFRKDNVTNADELSVVLNVRLSSLNCSQSVVFRNFSPID